MIRVLIADDQALVRAGFRLILEREADIEVAGEAATGIEAVRQVIASRPEVVLMDIRMPQLDGIEATRRLLERRPSTRVLILTTYDLDEYLYEALRAGASGFVLKDLPPEQLPQAVRTIASGEALLGAGPTRRLIEAFTRRPPPQGVAVDRFSVLTPRELEVLRLVAAGGSNREIAQILVVSETTVKSHVNSILGKLGLRDRVQAVVMAFESGLVEPARDGHLGANHLPRPATDSRQ